MNCHLVSVEVRVEGGTYQGMQLDGLTLYQNRLKGLDTQSVQRRSTVQHNGMLLDHVLQHIPYAGLQTLHHLLGSLDVMSGTVLHQLLHNEGLEQLDGHLLGQTALIDLQLRSHHDNGTAGIVYTLSKKILTEASLLTLQHIGKGLEGSVSGAGYRAAPSSVIDQRIHSLLQHTLFVSDNDLRGAQLQQALQTVVSVNDPSVEVVQVGGGKSAAVQLDHGTDIRWDHGDHRQDHPLRFVAGSPESLYYLQALYDTGPLLACGVLQLCRELLGLLVQVNGL